MGGGGGGAGTNGVGTYATGGAGGGIVGGTGSGTNAGTGGAQQGPSPCNQYCLIGTFGAGAIGAIHTGGGGGGGGWYGGSTWFFGGGAGSGFITQLAKTNSFPAPTNTGNGRVIITTG